MIFQRYDHSVVETGGKIYCIGGRLRQHVNSKIRKCEVFDPLLQEWMEIDSLPEQICNSVAVACKNKIFCISGSSNNYFMEGKLLVKRKTL